MNFDALKLDFLNFLEKEGKIDLSDLKAEDLKEISIFMYADKFTEYMEQKGEKIDVSELITKLAQMNFENGQFVQNEEQGDDSSVITGLLNDLFQQESVINSIDTDGNGISQEEMLSFISDMGGADGENDNLSMQDILSKINEINGNSEVENPEVSETPESPESSETPESLDGWEDTTPPPGVESGNYKKNQVGGNNSGVYQSQNITPASPTEASDKTVDSIKEIEQKIADDNKAIEQNNNEKAKVFEKNEVYQGLISDLNTVTGAIQTNKTNITTFESELHSIQVSIAQKQSELDNLEDPKVFTEYQADISAKREELKKEIEELKKKETDKQKELDDEKDALKDNETKKAELEGKISEIEESNPNDEIKALNDAIKDLEADITKLEKEKEDKQKELDKQRETEKSDAQIYGELKAYRESNEFVKYMMDLATDPATKAKYEANKSAGAYCAIFTSEITEAMFAEVKRRTGGAGMVNNGADANSKTQGMTGDQMAMHATAWGQKAQAALEKAGINVKATVTIRQSNGHYVLTDENGKQIDPKDAVRKGLIRPGMTFEYEVNGNYHTGFIESFNADLTWNTIEGNTTGGNVGSHVHDASYGKLSSVTDATLKTAYWMVQAGIMTPEEVNRIYHLNA